MKKYILFSALAFLIAMPVGAKSKKEVTGKQAQELFMKVYDMVFGPVGSTLSYKVNLIGIYKADGKITYKGKKSHFDEGRYSSWRDEKVIYKADHKKKIVNIHAANDEKADKYLSKFKHDVNGFAYSYIDNGTTYEITAKVKKSSMFGIKRVKAVVDKATLAPKSISVKLAMITTTVQITDFKAGDVDDEVFIFPKQLFKDYKFKDHR